MDLLKERERGLAAKAIIQSDIWKEAVDALDASLLDKMERHHSDPQACQEIALTRVVARNFISWFEEMAQTGEMAEIQLNREAEIEARNKERGSRDV